MNQYQDLVDRVTARLQAHGITAQAIVKGGDPRKVIVKKRKNGQLKSLSGRNTIMTEKKRVLILCTGNSARSQMAEGLLRQDVGNRFEVASAGVEPSRVRPEAIEVMREIGIDISDHRSKSVDEFGGQDFDYVITVCDNANERCPIFPAGTKRIHWSFDDPAAVEGDNDTRLNVFRRIRDEIRQRLRLFSAATSR